MERSSDFKHVPNLHFEPWGKKHEIYFYQKEKYGPVADLCAGCSDLDAGYLVPVSFCSEAQKDSDRWYEEMRDDYIQLLIQRGLENAQKEQERKSEQDQGPVC